MSAYLRMIHIPNGLNVSTPTWATPIILVFEVGQQIYGRQGYVSRDEFYSSLAGLTNVGERDVKLSGGQRQRIAIARVFLKDAPIVRLYEATSALDSDAKAVIQESVFELMAGNTMIAIAHRPSAIASLDRLVVIDTGKIIEIGTHAELVNEDGV